MKRPGKKLKEVMIGPAGSIILHIFIVIALVKLVFFATQPDEPDIEVVMMDIETVELEIIKEELELELEETLEELTPPDMSADVDVPDLAEEPHIADVLETDFAQLDVVETVKSPLVLRSIYANRGAAGRKAALRKHGGNEKTERAVVLALEWLKDHQLEDGSWAPEKEEHNMGKEAMMKRAAYAGLGLLTFLAHGELPSGEQYGETMEGAIRFILESQNDDGSFGGISRDAGHGVYAHAIATYAISEAYGMTGIPTLQTAMERAVSFIVSKQQVNGGFDYYYNDKGRRDTSIGGWHVQALEAAKMAGCTVPGLQASIDKALADLRTAQLPEVGFFGYSVPETNINNTAVAVLCFQMTGNADDPACKKGVKALQNVQVEWDSATPDVWSLYGWYYVTQSMFHSGGNTWNKWNREFSSVYVKKQNKDGSWDSPGRHEQHHGRPFSTCLAALSLQVYYRHLPTYQLKKVAEEEVEDEDDEDDEGLIEVI